MLKTSITLSNPNQLNKKIKNWAWNQVVSNITLIITVAIVTNSLSRMKLHKILK